MDQRESARERRRDKLAQWLAEDGPLPKYKLSTTGECPTRLPRYASLAQAHADLLALAARNPEGTLRGWFFCGPCQGIHLKKTGTDRRGLTMEELRKFDRAWPRTTEQLAEREQRALAVLRLAEGKRQKKKRYAENVRQRKKQVFYSQLAGMLRVLVEAGDGTEIE